MLSIKDLKEIKGLRYLNIKLVIEESELNPNTIATKLKRGTELDVDESTKLEKAILTAQNRINAIMKRRKTKQGEHAHS